MRVLWSVPAFLISAYYIVEFPEAIYSITHPSLRKGFEVEAGWAFVFASPFVAVAVIAMFRRAFANPSADSK